MFNTFFQNENGHSISFKSKTKEAVTYLDKTIMQAKTIEALFGIINTYLLCYEKWNKTPFVTKKIRKISTYKWTT